MLSDLVASATVFAGSVLSGSVLSGLPGTVSPSPVDPGSTVPKPDTVSPGFAGFAAIFLLAVATVLLLRSMTKHLRKVRYAAERTGELGGGAGRPDKITGPPPRATRENGTGPT